MPTGEPPGAVGPFAHHLHCLGVHYRDLVLVHQVDVGFALAIGGKKFRLAAQLDGWIRFARGGIHIRRNRDEHPGISAHHEDFATGRIIDDPVGVVGGFDFAQHGVAFQIKNGDGTILAIGDEASPGAGNDGHAMIALLAGDIRHSFARFGVEHQSMRRAGNVEQLALGIYGQVIPTAIPPDVEHF